MLLSALHQNISTKCFSFILLNHKKRLNYGKILILRQQNFCTSKNSNSSISSKVDQFLSKNYPKIHKYYLMTVDGSKLCLSDTKVYFKLRKQILMKERSLADFSISELLIYLQTSQNLPKMLSLLFVSFVVPLGLPLVIVTMILYPQIVLTRHFWTSQQINQVQLNELNKNKIILKQLLEINKNFVNQLPIEFSQLSKLNNLPKIEELSFLQLYLLKRLYKVSPLSFGSNALIQHIYILQLLDQKMLGDQNKTLSGDELRLHLYLRKLNYDKMDIESMRILLNKWLQNCSELPLSTYAFSPCLLQP